MYYSAISVLAALILVIENQDVMRNRNGAFSRRVWSLYRRFLVFVFVYYITDILWGILEALKLAVPLFIDTSLYFVAMALGLLTWIEYIVTYLEENKTLLGRGIILFGRIFAGLTCALVILNIFVPVLFSISSTAVYSEHALRNAVLIVQVVFLLLVSGYATAAFYRKHSDKKNRYRTLIFFGLIMAVFFVAQLLYPLLPLCGIGYMLGTCLLHTFVIGDEKEEYRLELEETKRINHLKQSLTSLLNNMPVMSFSKDVKTGAYLACNQAFADYAGKSSPEEIAGLTDAELFESANAASFVEADKLALEMERPYVFDESVTDANGKQWQFRTTKLKFYDESDRLCLLGMMLDMTEMERVRKENELAKEAYEEAVNVGVAYENIINALSKDYFNLYYVNIQTNDYVEYGSQTPVGYRAQENHGEDFFEKAKTQARDVVYEEDLEELLAVVQKDALLREIEQCGVFVYYYRLIIEGEPSFVCLKATRILGDENHIILGISNVDEQMKDHIAAEQAKEERKSHVRLNAFNRNLLALYIVETESEAYTEYNATADYDKLGIAKQGEHFFETAYKNSAAVVYEEDLDLLLERLKKETILQTIQSQGIFVLDYRLMIEGEPKYVRLKAAEVEEDGIDKLIIGVEDIDARVRNRQQQEHDLSVARRQASTDALTGVKNKFVFEDMQKELNAQIAAQEAPPFAVVVCDINDLKQVNDVYGHQQGDEYIRAACMSICNVFRHSPVFRIGGDEFVVICRGHDYENREQLLAEIQSVNEEHAAQQKVQIAYGLACYEAGDSDVQAVFERADKRMYENKVRIKTPSTADTAARALYVFPEELKKAYESSALSFVYYQNVDGKAVPILASDGFCRNTGMERENVISWLETGMFERMHPDDVGIVSEVSDNFLNKRGPYDVVFRCQIGSADAISASNHEHYVYIHGLGKWQTMPDGMELAVITYANLSATQQSVREQTEFYALRHKDVFYTDPLTELPNINYLHEYGNEKINVVRAAGKTPYLVYVDIDSMHSYNNQYGYKEGDNLIMLCAETLKAQLPTAFVARESDDHFILITPAHRPSQLEKRLYKINKMIRKAAYGNTTGIRCGVFTIENDELLFVDALDRAKQALKSIENDMNKEVAFYSVEASETYLRNRYILENFDKALEEERFKVHYHALYRLETGKVAAFEALARWKDPQRGKIYPSEFVPVLLKYHQLYKLDLYMFEQVCKEVSVRYENGLPLVPVSINFSRQDFDHYNIVEEMNRLYEKYALSRLVGKDYFIIEITEQDMALGKDNLRAQLHAIRENGYRLWMDDFGSGYSSLNMLSQFEFDVIKYDMDLLRNLDDKGGTNRILLKEFNRIAAQLGIHTLVEGVETQEQYEFVKNIGCEVGQGYYFTRPESLEQILTDIANGRPVKDCETPEEREEMNRKNLSVVGS